jgi:hypothetical protein
MFLIFLGLWWIDAPVFDAPRLALSGTIHAGIGLGMGIALLSLLVMGAAALPLLIWVGGRGPLSFRKVLFLGAVAGNVPFPVIVIAVLLVQLTKGTLSWDVSRLWDGLFGTVRAVALGLVIGPASAAVFWVVGVWGTEAQRLGLPRSRPSNDTGH